MFNRIVYSAIIFAFISVAVLFSGENPLLNTVPRPEIQVPVPKIYTKSDLDAMLNDDIKASMEQPVIASAVVHTGIDAKQLKCLQENIFFESRDQSIIGQAFVGITVLSRKVRHNYPNTLCSVVFQKMQFSWANNGIQKPNLKNPIERDAWNRAGTVAEWLVDSGIAQYVNSITHYHTTKVKPRWANSSKLKPILVIGDHVFYSENI